MSPRPPFCDGNDCDITSAGSWDHDGTCGVWDAQDDWREPDLAADAAMEDGVWGWAA